MDTRYAYAHKSLDLKGSTPDENLSLKMRNIPFGLLEASCYQDALNHLGSTYRIRTIERPEFEVEYDRDKKWEVVRKVFMEADKKLERKKEND